MNTIHNSTTAAGHPVTYASDRLATWLEIDHGKGKRTAIYATPGWAGGLERIRELIARHGIKIRPEHTSLFSNPALTS